MLCLVCASSFYMPLKDNVHLYLLLLPHSGFSSSADSTVTTSICALTKGGRTWPETAAPAKEESPSSERGERYVRHCKLSKQGLYETHSQAVEGQVKWVRHPRWVKILDQPSLPFFFLFCGFRHLRFQTQSLSLLSKRNPMLTSFKEQKSKSRTLGVMETINPFKCKSVFC